MITLPLPPSTNSLHPDSGARRVNSEEYKQWRRVAQATLAEQVIREDVPPEAKVYLRAIAYVGNPRRDLSNTIKPLEDLLAECLGFDDRRVYGITWTREDCDKGAERIDVDIQWRVSEWS